MLADTVHSSDRLQLYRGVDEWLAQEDMGRIDQSEPR